MFQARWMKSGQGYTKTWEPTSFTGDAADPSARLQQVLGQTSDLMAAFVEQEAEWELENQEAMLTRLAAEAQLSLQSSKVKESRKQINSLQDEKQQHMRKIAELEEQLVAARLEASQNAALILRRDQQLLLESEAREQAIETATAAAQQAGKLREQVSQQAKILMILALEADCHKQAAQQLGQSYSALLASKEAADELHAAELQAANQGQALLQQQVNLLSSKLQEEADTSKQQLLMLHEQLTQQESMSKERLQSLQGQLNDTVAVHEQELKTVRTQLNNQLACVTEQLTLAEQRLQEQVDILAAGDMHRQALLHALEAETSKAKAEEEKILLLHEQLEEQAAEHEQAACRAQSAIKQLEEQLDREAKVHLEDAARLCQKTADLILSSFTPDEGTAEDEQELKSQVLQLLTKLYSDEIDEEYAAQQLAAMKCELLMAASEAHQETAAATSATAMQQAGKGAVVAAIHDPSAEPPLPLSRSASGQNPWMYQTSFVMDDSAKLMRLINRASQIRQLPLQQHEPAVLPTTTANGAVPPKSNTWQYPWLSNKASTADAKAVDAAPAPAIAVASLSSNASIRSSCQGAKVASTLETSALGSKASSQAAIASSRPSSLPSSRKDVAIVASIQSSNTGSRTPSSVVKDTDGLKDIASSLFSGLAGAAGGVKKQASMTVPPSSKVRNSSNLASLDHDAHHMRDQADDSFKSSAILMFNPLYSSDIRP